MKQLEIFPSIINEHNAQNAAAPTASAPQAVARHIKPPSLQQLTPTATNAHWVQLTFDF